MSKLLDTFISVVMITDSETRKIKPKIVRATKILKEHYANYEVVVVANGLPGTELAEVKEILRTVPCIRVIRLTRTESTDTAIYAGVEAVIGDHVCILYNNDPESLVPKFVGANQDKDIVFGVAKNLKRQSTFEAIGAKLFYWYNKRYVGVDIPAGSTYYMCLNRSAANALTRSNRNVRHIRHLAKLIGFDSINLAYELPKDTVYTKSKRRDLVLKAFDMLSSYSSHPLRVLTYFGILAGLLNLVYAVYVVIVNLYSSDVAKGWTTLSLQSSIMFFILCIILAMLSEYIGKLLVDSRGEPPYHIMDELSSTISLADETRRNVTK
jgi:glycosyltransferase involved in cell wall biosynthesis